MGHDLPKPLLPDFIELIATHAEENQLWHGQPSPRRSGWPNELDPTAA